jgi:hypothetical protein
MSNVELCETISTDFGAATSAIVDGTARLDSPTTGKIAEALAKAQGSLGKVLKGKANLFFNSKYADLAAYLDVAREPFAAQGLAILQRTLETDGSTVRLETRLMHSSGEYLGSVLVMRPVKADPQGIGSAITYARRYALAPMLGLAAEDDDGNAASGNTAPATGVAKPARRKKNLKLKEEEDRLAGSEFVEPPSAREKNRKDIWDLAQRDGGISCLLTVTRTDTQEEAFEFLKQMTDAELAATRDRLVIALDVPREVV